MTDAHPRATPMVANLQLYPAADDDEIVDTSLYQGAIGSLMWLALCTRPDILFAVMYTAQFAAMPTQAHWSAVKGIFRYIVGTLDWRLRLGGKGPVEVIGYADADWAGDAVSRRSQSGYVFKLGDGSVSFSTSKQRTVSLSSMESECKALCTAVREAMWIRKIERDYEVANPIPLTIREDNQGAIAVSMKPSHHGRTKHYDTQLQYVRERIADGDIAVEYIQTGYNTANILTKPLGTLKFQHHRHGLGVVPSDIPHPDRVGVLRKRPV